MKVAAIIVAAGRGVRMGEGPKKQFISLAGTPVLARAMAPFDRCRIVDEIYLVIGAADQNICQKKILDSLELEKPVHLVTGGVSRQESVFNGIKATQGRFDTVAIHDGVRPLIGVVEISKTIEAACTFGAAIMAIPSNDTVKIVERDDCIKTTVERKKVWLAQTPQAFRYHIIYDAHKAASDAKYEGTDDASLVERQRITVKIVPGSPENIKITTPKDLMLAETFLKVNQVIAEESH